MPVLSLVSKRTLVAFWIQNLKLDTNIKVLHEVRNALYVRLNNYNENIVHSLKLSQRQDPRYFIQTIPFICALTLYTTLDNQNQSLRGLLCLSNSHHFLSKRSSFPKLSSFPSQILITSFPNAHRSPSRL